MNECAFVSGVEGRASSDISAGSGAFMFMISCAILIKTGKREAYSMAKSSNQKLKMLIIRDFLLRMSDQDHPVTVQQIIDELESFDIKA